MTLFGINLNGKHFFFFQFLKGLEKEREREEQVPSEKSIPRTLQLVRMTCIDRTSGAALKGDRC